MEATTPTGSRRIMLVMPGSNSPATAPVRQRAAPAKKAEQRRRWPGFSSASASAYGLPVLRDSILRELGTLASMASAI